VSRVDVVFMLVTTLTNIVLTHLVSARQRLICISYNDCPDSLTGLQSLRSFVFTATGLLRSLGTYSI